MNLQQEKQNLLSKLNAVSEVNVVSRLNGPKGLIVAKPTKKNKKAPIKPNNRRRALSARRTLKATGCGGCRRGK